LCDSNAWIDKVFGFFAQGLGDMLGNQTEGVIAPVCVRVLHDNDPSAQAFVGWVAETQLVEVNRRNRPTTQIKNAGYAARSLGQTFEGQERQDLENAVCFYGVPIAPELEDEEKH
jgi:hypothetical protein